MSSSKVQLSKVHNSLKLPLGIFLALRSIKLCILVGLSIPKNAILISLLVSLSLPSSSRLRFSFKISFLRFFIVFSNLVKIFNL